MFCSNSEIIVPNINLSCNGRVTGYSVSLHHDPKDDNECDEDGNGSDNEYRHKWNNNEGNSKIPVIQIWRPNINSSIYYTVKALCLPSALDITRAIDIRGDEYYLWIVSCVRINSVEFQSGDVIGYKYTNGLRYGVWSIKTARYKSCHIEGSLHGNASINLSDNAVKCDYDKRPLIQLIFGKIAVKIWIGNSFKIIKSVVIMSCIRDQS